MNRPLPSLVPQSIIDEMIQKAKATPPGCFVEVGVYKGGTAWHLTRLAAGQDREIFLYDTFTGIPYQGPRDSHKVGDFHDTSYRKVRAALPYATVVKGIFPLSAVDMPPVAFAHLDCDQYDAVYGAVTYLISRMVPGGIIWFDDTTTLEGAKEALLDLVGENIIPPAQVSKENRHYVVIPPA